MTISPIRVEGSASRASGDELSNASSGTGAVCGEDRDGRSAMHRKRCRTGSSDYLVPFHADGTMQQKQRLPIVGCCGRLCAFATINRAMRTLPKGRDQREEAPSYPIAILRLKPKNSTGRDR